MNRSKALITTACTLLTVFLMAGSWTVYRFGEDAKRTRTEILGVARKLSECTTPGPRPPTRDDPRTGHDCWDEGQKRTGAVVGQIVDGNGNQISDIQELAGALGVSLPTTSTTIPKGQP